MNEINGRAIGPDQRLKDLNDIRAFNIATVICKEYRMMMYQMKQLLEILNMKVGDYGGGDSGGNGNRNSNKNNNSRRNDDGKDDNDNNDNN